MKVILRLLLAGVFFVSTTIDAAVAQADSPSGTWTSISPMPIPHMRAMAVSGADGRIYVISGFNPQPTDGSRNVCPTEVDIFSPSSDSWSSATPVPFNRVGTEAALGPDGRIYVSGGMCQDSDNNFYVYDPTSDHWTDMSPIPVLKGDCGGGGPAVNSHGRIYVIGSCFNLGPVPSPLVAYDPATASWATLASTLYHVWDPAAAVGPDGRIYVIGGSDPGTASTPLQEYDPSTDVWSRRTSLPQSFGFQGGLEAASGTDGRIYVVGLGKTVETYDPATDTWTTAPPLQVARYAPAVATGRDGRIYVFGGGTADNETAFNSAEVYTSTASASSSGPPACRFILGFATLQGLLPNPIGTCLEDQAFAANGDAQQHTTNGLLVWRKADNWTAFTDGYHTWINGPTGLQERLNTQRFPWEANPDGLAVVGQ